MEVFALIKKSDLLDAIAECQGERNPNANTCIKLAAFYTILNNMFDEDQPVITGYSMAGETSQAEQVGYDSGSEFSNCILNANVNDVLAIIDELMDVIHAVAPRLYNATIEKLNMLHN